MTKNIFTTTNIYRVGRYQYSSNDIIGSGEFGKVYKGIRTIDKLPVAIKTVDFIQHAE
jgi:serine/threonine protein kinase